MDWMTNPEAWIAFATLLALEIVLGIDNVVFISILAGKLPANQQAAIMSVGADMEKFALESAKADDIEVSNVYLKAGAKVYDLDEPTVKKWQAIARETAWKDYAAKSDTSAKLLAAAVKTL